MSKVVIALLASFALVQSAAAIAGGTRIAPANTNANNVAGVYVSGNLGYGDIDIKMHSTPATTSKHKGFAWSTAIGYQFSKYLAVETGYIQFARQKVSLKGNPNYDSTTLTTDAVDLAVKGIYPISEQFSLFGKVGIAYLSHKDVETTNSMNVITTSTNHHIVPLFAAGASYNISQNWAVDLQGIVTPKSGVHYHATYTGLAGVTYKFS